MQLPNASYLLPRQNAAKMPERTYTQATFCGATSLWEEEAYPSGVNPEGDLAYANLYTLGPQAQDIRGLPQPIAETTALDYSWSR